MTSKASKVLPINKNLPYKLVYQMTPRKSVVGGMPMLQLLCHKGVTRPKSTGSCSKAPTSLPCCLQIPVVLLWMQNASVINEIKTKTQWEKSIMRPTLWACPAYKRHSSTWNHNLFDKEHHDSQPSDAAALGIPPPALRSQAEVALMETDWYILWRFRVALMDTQY